MKILSAEQIRAADAYTIAEEPIASIELMERAASVCADWIAAALSSSQFSVNVRDSARFAVLAGIGNNGGDGLAIARMLSSVGQDVAVLLVGNTEKASADFKTNLDRLKALGNVEISRIDLSDIPSFKEFHFIIDAIFGTGLNRPVAKDIQALFASVNTSKAKCISIDMPSGLQADAPIPESDIAISADVVLTFQVPKLGLLLHENSGFVGDVQILDIGLHPKYFDTVQTNNHLFGAGEAPYVRKRRPRFSHKGSFGHCLIIGGSKGMAGAPALAAQACLRSGAGLVTVYSAAENRNAIQALIPEAMFLSDTNSDEVSQLPVLRNYNTIAIGPGLGQSDNTAQVLKTLIQTTEVPLVLDADALNILAENPTWLSFLPKGSVLTPHPGEFARLVGKKPSHFEALQLQREWSRKHGVYIVLKGAHTSVSFPDGNIWINNAGNPGMATAGMGDTLTGIISGLMSSGYSSGEAAIFGVYLHGHAGDLALASQSLESLLASDLIEHIGKAFQSIGYAD